MLEKIRELEDTRRAAALYKSHPKPRSPADFVSWLGEIPDGKREAPDQCEAVRPPLNRGREDKRSAVLRPYEQASRAAAVAGLNDSYLRMRLAALGRERRITGSYKQMAHNKRLQRTALARRR